MLVLWLQLQQERRKGVWKTWSGAREKRPRQAVLHGRRRWHRLQRRLAVDGLKVAETVFGVPSCMVGRSSAACCLCVACREGCLKDVEQGKRCFGLVGRQRRGVG